MGIKGTRREFLGDVGRGMLVAGVGFGTAVDLGLTSAHAEGGEDTRLRFGEIDSLVGMMQETPITKLIPVLLEKLGSGTELKQLVAAAALANARTFGGEDYIGFHTLMALAPAYRMASELPVDRQALPFHEGRPCRDVARPATTPARGREGRTPRPATPTGAAAA